MNLLGPLLNPAGVSRQVIGVSQEPMLRWFGGSPRATGGQARVGAARRRGNGRDQSLGSELGLGDRGGRASRWELEPSRYGLACDDLDELAGGEPTDNAAEIERLLTGQEKRRSVAPLY